MASMRLTRRNGCTGSTAGGCVDVVCGTGVLVPSVMSVNGRTASAQKGPIKTYDDNVDNDDVDGDEDTEWSSNECYIQRGDKTRLVGCPAETI